MPLPLCVRINADDTASRDALLVDGWRDIETLVTYVGRVADMTATGIDTVDVTYVLNRAAEVDAVAELAGRIFTFDRLHRDTRVTKTDADEAKREWVRKAFGNPQCHIFTARVAGVLLGFLIVKLQGEVLLIDLIGVDLAAQGQGIGQSLIVGAISALRGWVDAVQVGTQDVNTDAKAFYEGIGFHRTKSQTTFHK